MVTKTATLTDQQKSQALANARKNLSARRNAAKRIRSNSFEAWGNDKCISRLIDTISAMERGTASVSQYRYWLTQ